MTFDKLQVGLKNSVSQTVTDNDTAVAVGSGSLKVLATPKMVALIEKSAAELVEQNLPAEYTSVGTSLNIKHTAPTPIGLTIRAEVELIEIAGRKLTFAVKASDNVGEIGNGQHERFIVERAKFQSKADSKQMPPI